MNPIGKYSWAIPQLDSLTGGIANTLHCVYGSTASGKSTLSGYYAIARVVAETKQLLGELPERATFFVVDGDGGFDLDRAKEIWRNNGLDADEIEKHLCLREVTEFDEQHKYITKELPDIIKNEEKIPLLFVVDPISDIYRGIVLRTAPAYRGKVIGEYSGKIDLQVHTIRHLAVSYGRPAFVTTWSSSPLGEAMRISEIRRLMSEEKMSREEAERMVVKPELPFIGGRCLGYLPKMILGLSIPIEGDPMREVYLYKARGLPSGGKCHVYLSNKGISERRD